MRHCGTQTIETQRLLLRRFCLADCNDMLNNWIASEKIQFEYGEPVYTTESQVNELLDKWISNYSNPDFYRWAIIEKDSDQNMGQIAFCSAVC